MSHNFDISLAHKVFSAECFNNSWTYIEKGDRSELDNMKMLSACHASLWHWLQREDCTPKHRSIGYWQISRVYSLLEAPNLALHYAELCLSDTPETLPFYMGYAHEALSGAVLIGGNPTKAREHLDRAFQYLASVPEGRRPRMAKEGFGEPARVSRKLSLTRS